MSKPVSNLPIITPEWDAPASVIAFTTTTAGGISTGGCASLNLGTHVGDEIENVLENRSRLQQFVGEGVRLCWLRQTHSDIVIDANQYTQDVEGDASVSCQAQRACVVMTADCLPVLLSNTAGTRVAALHCGWKGLHQNLIGKTLSKYFHGESVLAWLGPAIGQQSYEVDEGLFQHFIRADSDYAAAFSPNRSGHYLMNLYAIARQQLAFSGVVGVFGGDYDTFNDPRFFSHRRNASSGRMASVIYFKTL